LKTEGILETDLEKLTSTSAWTCGATISVNCDLDNLETDADVSTTLKLFDFGRCPAPPAAVAAFPLELKLVSEYAQDEVKSPSPFEKLKKSSSVDPSLILVRLSRII
jgi:hypothetical protein